MGFVKDTKASSMAASAARAIEEGHYVFVAQIRGPVSHSPKLSRAIPDAAEMIEAIERQGWALSKFDSLVYDNNTTLVCLFRRRA